MHEKQQPTAAARYDTALRRSHKLTPIPDDCPVPQPTAHWPPENIDLLEKYQSWLVASGASPAVIAQHRIPMAGHVLGLALKPHSQLDLETDLQAAMTYIEAKQLSSHWTNNCRHSLRWFRDFLALERGLVVEDVQPAYYGSIEQYQEGLPDWLITHLEQYLHLRQANWRRSRLAQMTYGYWHKHTKLWRWLFTNHAIKTVSDIKRSHLFAFMDELLTEGYAATSVNLFLYSFQATLRFLQGRGLSVTQALLNVPGLRTPDSLPRFLTDAQVARLQNDLAQRVETAKTSVAHRNALLDRAAFYLLWQAGLRVSEAEDLLLTALNLPQQRLLVRQSKGLQDRTVYLTETTVSAVEAYLPVRGEGSSEHLFLYRYRPLSKDLIRVRMKAAGKRVGVYVTPHMLRHTFATQLVNAGCRITTIQSLLGHQRLNSTMVYARIHDQTVADDYYAAMRLIENQMHLQPVAEPNQKAKSNGHNSPNSSPADLLTLVSTLQTEPLTKTQQAIVNELHTGLLTLAESLNGTPKQLDLFVNELAHQPQPLVEEMAL
jgi:integrase/recombinase XerC